MNSFGQVFRVSIYGESHGPEVGILIDGCPPGILLDRDLMLADLDRRKPGERGTTTRVESDDPLVSSGVFNGYTTGTPILIKFVNSNIRSGVYEAQKDIPRPGHADFTGHVKYKGFEDYRGGGHFSGRLTTGLVAAGSLAKQVISLTLSQEIPVDISARIVEIGGEEVVEKGIQKAVAAKDSVGGIIEVCVRGLPVGLGEPFFNSVESLIAHAVFSVPAIKGIEFGAGFEAAKMFGSAHNDAILDGRGRTETNHAGGIVGGLTNGNDLVYRVVVKPTASTPMTQESFNTRTQVVEKFSVKGRHDLCIALRIPVILEAVTALVLADLSLLRSR